MKNQVPVSTAPTQPNGVQHKPMSKGGKIVSVLFCIILVILAVLALLQMFMLLSDWHIENFVDDFGVETSSKFMHYVENNTRMILVAKGEISLTHVNEDSVITFYGDDGDSKVFRVNYVEKVDRYMIEQYEEAKDFIFDNNTVRIQITNGDKEYKFGFKTIAVKVHFWFL